ncbi:hypothetical protein GE061_001675 [Apolygus lucorum]|uniref:Retrotransposon gag domain-containing protein n=1 Tax=Apolygus lucorum TaxID=248454 RepID=A0A8S9YAW4_APOLU|nr:hypothetical protein GE061_001675 [Apolygus lucorum]
MAQPPAAQVVQQIIGMTTSQFQALIDSIRPAAGNQNKPDKTDYSGIPDFNGEPEILSQFIERCEELIEHFFNDEEPNCYANKVILNNIRAKIKGKAATGIFNAPLETWDEIKNALIANFDDKRDEEHLILEFGRLRQRQNEDPFEFHVRTSKLFTSLISKLKNSTEQYTPATLKLMEKVALRAFLMGLNEDVGRLLITKGPTDLNDAVKILTNEYQFPTLRKKLLHQKFPQPSTSTHQPQRQNFVKTKPFQKTNAPQPFNKSGPNFNKSSLNKTPQQPRNDANTPYIPYHLRTKDSMSYQTTLNHEVVQDDPGEEENGESDLQETEEQQNPDYFLEETGNYPDLT